MRAVGAANADLDTFPTSPDLVCAEEALPPAARAARGAPVVADSVMVFGLHHHRGSLPVRESAARSLAARVGSPDRPRGPASCAGIPALRRVG